MTLHDKILELCSIGFGVKFEQMSGEFYKNQNIYIGMRYHGIGSTKVENSKMITPNQLKDEQFLIAILIEIYKEMKPHAIGHQTLNHETID